MPFLFAIIIFVTFLKIPESIIYGADRTINTSGGKDTSNLLTVDETGTIGSITEKSNGKFVTTINLPDVLKNNTTVQKLIIPKGIYKISNINYSKMDSSMLRAYRSLTPSCPMLATVEVDDNNSLLTSVEGVLYSKDGKTLLYCPPGKAGDLIVPEGVTKISFLAFQECEKLTRISLPSTVTEIDEAAFGGNSSLKVLEVSKANPCFQSKSNVIFTKSGETLVAYAAGKKSSSYTIPRKVKIIRAAAFMGCRNLTQINTYENLTTISVEAFENCTKLKNIKFTKGLRDIYAGAFRNCSSLVKLNFPDGTRYIFEDAFTGCSKLVNITLPKSVQSLPGDLYSVEGRTIWNYSPYSFSNVEGDKADNITVYCYPNSTVATYLKKNKIAIKYYKTNFVTDLKMDNVPATAVRGRGKADKSWYSINALEYTIKNPDQLAGLAELVNTGTDFYGKKVNLISDLDLSCYPNWIPIGKQSVNGLLLFKGTFNGNNHMIYNLRSKRSSDCQGLFGAMNGTISDVVVSNAQVAGNNWVGILCGATAGGRINNCKVSGKVSGNEATGGLVGQCFSSIRSCSVNAEISGILSTGGIAGSNHAVISGCSNNGKVSGYEQVGGYAGVSFDGSEIKNSSNSMTVTGDINVGGFVGFYFDGTGINSSTNNGAVTGSENVGGITGNLRVTLDNCTNKGIVSGTYNTGGIAGTLNAGYIKNCLNGGAVSGTSGVGGILGYLYYIHQPKERVLISSNTGKVSGRYNYTTLIGKDRTNTDLNQLMEEE